MTAPQHPLVELASSALVHLGHIPSYGKAHKNSSAEVDKAWVRAPLFVAVGGAVAARTELVNYLCGKAVLDPATRAVDAAPIRIIRGKRTAFRAERDDGTTEEHVLPPEELDDASLQQRAEAARVVVDERKLALERVERSLPRFARARPHGIMIILWPLWWLLTRRHRRALGERTFAEKAFDQATDAQKHAQEDLETRGATVRAKRARFFESLRALASGGALGGRVREVVLELSTGPLPEGIQLLELARGAAIQSSEPVDAVLFVERDAFFAPPDGDEPPPKIGPVADIVPTLLVLVGKARALVLARRARAVIEPILTRLDDDISDTEEGFRVRIERLEAMQILDPKELAAAELEKIKPQVSSSIHAVIEHGAAHAGADLERLGNEWAHAMSISQNAEQLKQSVMRIETSAPADARRIAEETRSLLIAGAAGAAHDIFPELLAKLRPLGLEERPPREAPQLPLIEVLPSLASASPAKLSGAASWLTGLFRSFETKRAEVLEKATARIAHLREVAAAEILDAEPKLRALIEESLYAQFLAAIDRQVAWLDKTLIAEREAVGAEGVALAPLARMRDRLRHDFVKLAEGIQQIEREVPGLVAVASAPASASGTISSDA